MLEDNGEVIGAENKWVVYDTLKAQMNKLPDLAINFFIERHMVTVKYNKVQFANKINFMAALQNFG